MINTIFIVFIFIIFNGCSGKELKKYGGDLAVNGGGGNPIMAGAGLIVGGTIYGIGSFVDNEEKKKSNIKIEKE